VTAAPAELQRQESFDSGAPSSAQSAPTAGADSKAKGRARGGSPMQYAASAGGDGGRGTSPSLAGGLGRILTGQRGGSASSLAGGSNPPPPQSISSSRADTIHSFKLTVEELDGSLTPPDSPTRAMAAAMASTAKRNAPLQLRRAAAAASASASITEQMSSDSPTGQSPVAQPAAKKGKLSGLLKGKRGSKGGMVVGRGSPRGSPRHSASGSPRAASGSPRAAASRLRATGAAAAVAGAGANAAPQEGEGKDSSPWWKLWANKPEGEAAAAAAAAAAAGQGPTGTPFAQSAQAPPNPSSQPAVLAPAALSPAGSVDKDAAKRAPTIASNVSIAESATTSPAAFRPSFYPINPARNAAAMHPPPAIMTKGTASGAAATAAATANKGGGGAPPSADGSTPLSFMSANSADKGIKGKQRGKCSNKQLRIALPVIFGGLILLAGLGVGLYFGLTHKKTADRTASGQEQYQWVGYDVQAVVEPPQGAPPGWGCGSLFGNPKVSECGSPLRGVSGGGMR